MENNEITPFVTETAVVITDKSSNELNIEYYADEIAMYGTYQSSGWNDPILAAIKEHLQKIHNALPEIEDSAEGEIPEDFKLSLQAGKKPPVVKINFNIYSNEAFFKPAIAEFIKKIQTGIDAAE